MSSRYAIEWLDASGKRIALIQREVSAPALSDKEKAAEEKNLDGIAKQNGITRAQLPMTVPERKQPISEIGFDLDGRLWVGRSVVQGTPRIADVYDRSGKWVAIMEWPPEVDLSLWTINGQTAIGIARDSLDVRRSSDCDLLRRADQVLRSPRKRPSRLVVGVRCSWARRSQGGS